MDFKDIIKEDVNTRMWIFSREEDKEAYKSFCQKNNLTYYHDEVFGITYGLLSNETYRDGEIVRL